MTNNSDMTLDDLMGAKDIQGLLEKAKYDPE